MRYWEDCVILRNMTYDPDQLPDDPSELKRIIQALLDDNAKKQATLDALVAEVARLNVTIQKLTEMLFGKKNKKLANITTAQEQSLSETETSPVDSQAETNSPPQEGFSETPQTSVPESLRQKKTVNGGGGRMKLPDDLPVKVVENHPPLEERTCDICETPFKQIGYSESKKLVYIPGYFEVLETHHTQWIADCSCCEKRSATGEPDIEPIDKGIVSISLLAIIIVMKYADHLPLARQATQTFFRSGIQLSQSSMCRWMRKAADLLEPLYNLMWELVLTSHCMQLDASFVKCRDENLKGKCKQTYVYGARGDETQPFDLFFFANNGTRDKLMEFLKEFHNIMQCDASSTYDQIFKPLKPVPGKLLPTEQGCWSHARDNFVNAMSSDAKGATEMLEMIGELYGVEKRAKKWTPAKRLALRQAESVAILDRIFVSVPRMPYSEVRHIGR